MGSKLYKCICYLGVRHWTKPSTILLLSVYIFKCIYLLYTIYSSCIRIILLKYCILSTFLLHGMSLRFLVGTFDTFYSNKFIVNTQQLNEHLSGVWHCLFSFPSLDKANIYFSLPVEILIVQNYSFEIKLSVFANKK